MDEPSSRKREQLQLIDTSTAPWQGGLGMLFNRKRRPPPPASTWSVPWTRPIMSVKLLPKTLYYYANLYASNLWKRAPQRPHFNCLADGWMVALVWTLKCTVSACLLHTASSPIGQVMDLFFKGGTTTIQWERGIEINLVNIQFILIRFSTTQLHPIKGLKITAAIDLCRRHG